MHRTIIEERQLPPGSDLFGAYVLALAAQVQNGWQLESFSSNVAVAFCSKGTDRRVIAVEEENPAQPTCR